MIVEQNGRRTRKRQFQFWKLKGKAQYVLAYRKRGRPLVSIPIDHGGGLACNFSPSGMVRAFGGDPLEFRPVSWRETPEEFRQAALVCMEHIEKHGDPFDNDESVF